MQSLMRSPVVRAAAAISNSPSAHPAPRPSLDHTLVHCDEQYGTAGQARAHGKHRACVRARVRARARLELRRCTGVTTYVHFKPDASHAMRIMSMEMPAHVPSQTSVDAVFGSHTLQPVQEGRVLKTIVSGYVHASHVEANPRTAAAKQRTPHTSLFAMEKRRLNVRLNSPARPCGARCMARVLPRGQGVDGLVAAWPTRARASSW